MKTPAAGQVLDSYTAIRLMRSYSTATDWPQHFHKVCAVLGFPSRFPTASEFVAAVSRWQASHPPLKGDGILGPATWMALRPAIEQYGDGPTPVGPCPDWMSTLNIGQGAKQGATKQNGSSTDAVMKESVSVSRRLEDDPLLPVEISVALLTDLTSVPSTGLSQVVPKRLMVPTLMVGQMWPGRPSGTRLILYIAPVGVGYAKNNFAGMYNILFVTDKGRIYAQDLSGWEQDYIAMFFAGVNLSLAPLETFLDSTAQFLLGAISATHPAAAAYVVGMGAVQWIATNKKAIGEMIAALEDVSATMKEVRKTAPTLHDKVLWAMLENIRAQMPASAIGNPKIMARFAGTLFIGVGKLILKRDASVFVESLKPVLKMVGEAIAAATQKAAAPAAISVLKGAPGAISPAARQLAADLSKFTVITPLDAATIVQELTANPQEVKRLLLELAEGAERLAAAVSSFR